MLSQHNKTFDSHHNLFQAGFKHDWYVDDQVRYNKTTADVADLVLRLYFRNKVCEAHHRVHDQQDHNFVEYLHAVDWWAPFERSKVANIYHLGHHTDNHDVDLHYDSSVINYREWDQNSSQKEDQQSY